ncbi:MAG: isoprenylcysteine carboxylmethyltransferase family protein [Firmicutes bacterium]|nr:isoprenylcysteine carboxylmethyltransferase family protein [Bacillota bacterium]
MTIGWIISSAIFFLMFPAGILALAGDWLWVEGWIFCAWFIVMCLAVSVYLYRNDPELLVERSRLPGTGNQQEWDKYLMTGIYLVFIVWFVVMPLDAKRYGGEAHFPVWLKALGGLLLLPSLYLFYQSCVDNTFASTQVRIQRERKQHVVSTGVYSFVRHPMYLGAVFMGLGAPLLLGSVYGLAVGLIMILVVAGRIIGEERMLVSELEGYEDYRRKVRYRLIPYVW